MMINFVAEKVQTPKGKVEMQWKKLIEPTVWAIWWLIVGGAGLWVIVGSIGFFVKEGWLPNDTSGWVQAIGSIGAILVAIWISGGERRHKAIIEKAASRDALARAIDASEHAKTTAQNCVGLFSSNSVQRGEMPRHLAAVEHAANRVKEISAGPGMDSELLGTRLATPLLM